MRLATFVLFSFLVFASWTRVYAQANDPPNPNPVILTDEQDEYPLGLHMEILEDPGGELTFEDVASPEYDSRFAPSQVEVPNYGFTDSVYWVRFNLRNEARMTNRWLLEVGFANTQFVDLYSPSPNGLGFGVKQAGSLRPASTRDVRNPHMIFELTLPTQGQQTFYLRFQNSASMTLPLTLWSPEAFLVESQQDLLRYGVFFGVMLGLLGYNLFLLISLREKSYLFLTLFIAYMIFFEASYSGYLETFAFPDLYSLKPIYQPLSFSLIFVWALLFSHSFLEVKTRDPRLHRLIIAILAVWGVLIILIPFTSYITLALLFVPWGIISLVAVLVAGIISWRQGFRPARFFMIAWLGFVVTLVAVMLVRLGVASSTPFSENAYHLGLMWMVVCWSIALADRINLLNAETEEANRELRYSERRLSQILEGLPLGVVVYGKDYKPNFINRRVTEILGNPAQGIEPELSAGRTLAEAMEYYSFRVTGNDQDYPLENMPVYRALQGEPASVDDAEVDLVDRRVPLEIWASPVRADSGDVDSAVVAFQDITQRKQMDAELEAYRKKLELLVEQRTEELSAANEQLNHEIIEREILEQLLYQHIEWLTKLNQVRQAIKGTADLPKAYDKLFATILKLLDAGSAFLLRWDGQDDRVEAVCYPQRDDSIQELEELASVLKKNSPMRQEIERGKFIVLSADQAASLPGPIRECFQVDGFQSLTLVPLAVRQSVAGLLGVATPQTIQDFTPAQAEFIETMTHDLAEMAEDAQLLDQARALVAAEERNRLARDLHDSVTQVLFSASLVAEVLPQIWRRDPEKAMQSLEELRRLTRGALAEMRTMLLELRPIAVTKTPLPELLAQLTEATTSRVELPFQLFIEKIPPLPEEVHTSFYRIAQEALNNVVKHAQASHVTVSLSAAPVSPDPAGNASWTVESGVLQLNWATPLIPVHAGSAGHEVKLVIEDDGVGFSPGLRGQEHLGIGIMGERAAAIQATLSVESQPGGGTQVILIWDSVLENSS